MAVDSMQSWSTSALRVGEVGPTHHLDQKKCFLKKLSSENHPYDVKLLFSATYQKLLIPINISSATTSNSLFGIPLTGKQCFGDNGWNYISRYTLMD